MTRDMQITGREVFFDDNEIIVSKTNETGSIIYANDIFLNIAGFNEGDIMGKPHSILRHPDTPRAVFKLMWETIKSKREIFAYICNRCKNGDHYWVLAHVTPSFDGRGDVNGFHSNRRTPDRRILENEILPFYRELSTIENAAANRKDGLDASTTRLHEAVTARAEDYDAFIHTL